jgi:Tat protein secretion system quality control protein TatD with DNase activity
LRIDLVGTTADYRRPGPPRPLPLNHLPGENRTTVCRIGEVGLTPLQQSYPERARQLNTFETHIGKPKRNWF